VVGGCHHGASFADHIAFEPGQFNISLTSALPQLFTGGDSLSGVGASVTIDGITKTFDCLTLDSADNYIGVVTIGDCLAAIKITSDDNSIEGVAVGLSQDGVLI
jgi:hypothetical protein